MGRDSSQHSCNSISPTVVLPGIAFCSGVDVPLRRAGATREAYAARQLTNIEYLKEMKATQLALFGKSKAMERMIDDFLDRIS